MSKALRIKIISYLREHDAITKYIDIRAHVLNDNDSVEERNELKATLDYLSNKRLIAINGSYEFLHWTVSYGLYNLDGKKIATKLTKTGQAYHPESESDDMEATVPPVLAVIKKGVKAKNESPVTTYDSFVEIAVEELPVAAEPTPLPWYTAPVQPETEFIAPPEPNLPWYVEPKAEQLPEPVEEVALPQYTEPLPAIAETTSTEPEPTLPWCVEPKAEQLSEAFEEALLPEYIEPLLPIAETIIAAPEPALPWDVIPEEEKPLTEAIAEPTPPPIAETIIAEPEPALPWDAIPEEEKPLTEAVSEPTPPPIAEAIIAEPEPTLPWDAIPEEEKPLAETIAEPALVPAQESAIAPEPELPWYTPPVHEEAEILTEAPGVKYDEPVAAKPPINTEPPAEERKTAAHDVLKALEEYVPLKPWYVEPVQQEPEQKVVIPEPKALDPAPVVIPVEESIKLPLTVDIAEPAPVEAVEKPLPDIEVKVPAAVEEIPALPWYTEAMAQAPAEPQPILNTEVTAPAPAAEEKAPVIYRFPPLEFKPKNVVKTPPPMVIERLNQNLSSGIDAISNIKIKKPEMLTGDFEKDSNVIMKFVLIVVLFLLFGCIVWVYMG